MKRKKEFIDNTNNKKKYEKEKNRTQYKTYNKIVK